MNRIFKNIVSILLITILIFDIIAPQLIINVNSSLIKNIKQSTYFEEYFSFRVRGRDVNIDTFPRFQSVEVPKEFPEFLVGIVNVDYDTDPISKTIARGVFLGMRSDEIIKEIENKHNSRISRSKINGKRVYTYSIEKEGKIEKIVAYLDDLIVDQRAKGGVAVILPVETSTITNETTIHNVFTLKSICINDESENEGIIRINDEDYSLPNLIELLKNKIYQIYYKPNEEYEFDHWEITGGKLVYLNNMSSNRLIIQNDCGEIIAYYRKIGVATTTTTSSASILTTSTSTSLKTSTTSSSIRTTQTSTTSIKTSSSKTQSLTSIKTEIKTTSTSIITITTVTSTITKVDVLPPYKSESTSYNSKSQTTIVTKTTTTATSTITSITKQEKSFLDTIGETITSIGNTIVSTGKSILEGTIDSISNGLVNAGKSIIEGINDISKRILHALGFYEENISFSETNCITTKTENQTYKAEVTYEGKTSSQTIKVTSTTTKTNITITTTSSKTSYITTNIIYTTTISKYTTKTITTKTTYPLKTETIYVTVKGFTTTYKTPIYTYTTIVTTKKTSTTSSQNYGGGGGRREGPLLRDSILLNKNVYKEFLDKIKKKEENRKLPLLYLVYKITPLRVEQNRYYKDMIIYKIRPIIKSYDNENRKCILSIGERGRKSNGLFLIKPNVDSIYEGFNVYSLFHEVNKEKLIKYGFEVSNEVIIDIKANEKLDNYLKIFFLEEENLPSFLGENYHSLNLYLYVYYNGELRLVDAEPNFQSGVKLSQFGETMLSFITGVSSAINSFAIASISFFFQKIFPPTVAYYAIAGTQLWSDYFAYKRIPQEEIINEAKSEAIIKSYEIIDIYSKNKEVAKKEITDYVYGFLMSIENIIDPINLGAGIVTGNLRNTLPGYMYSLLEDSFNPNLETRTRAAKFGEFIGITAAFCYASKLHEKIPKKLSELLKGKERIIEKQLNYIWIKDNKIASEALKLLDKISEKFEDVNDEALRTIKNIKLLLNNKIKNEDIISDIENAINKIDNIRSKKELLELANDMVYNRLKAVLIKFVGKEYDAHLKVDLFEKAGGKIFEKTSWALFEAFTEDGELIKFIRKIGNPDSAGRLHFTGKEICEKVGTNELYVRVAKMIVEPEDFYEIFKENVKEMDLIKSFVKLKSLNEIEIISKEGKAVKIKLNDEDMVLHWISDEGALGIKSKMLAQYGEDEGIAICYDGEKAFLEIIFEEEERDHGRKISKIELTDEEIRFNYKLSEKEERSHSIYLIKEPIIRISGNIIECIPNKGSLEAYIKSGSNNVRRGAIGEIWGSYVCKYIPNCEVKGISLGKGYEEFADLHLLWEGEICPGEVTVFMYYVGTSKKELKEIFNKLLRYDIINDALRKDFHEKANYITSKKGLGTVIGVPVDENGNPVGYIDILTVEVPIVDNIIREPKIIFKPAYWDE
ncbi:MAG: hypothetical protein QXM32_06335 [Nitrososphaerota archaeon]